MRETKDFPFPEGQTLKVGSTLYKKGEAMVG